MIGLKESPTSCGSLEVEVPVSVLSSSFDNGTKLRGPFPNNSCNSKKGCYESQRNLAGFVIGFSMTKLAADVVTIGSILADSESFRGTLGSPSNSITRENVL
ncbi:hypothetical protein AVEN_9697-1 [Araneus ventricosus]|uniref:Uncharacterized protein n=1 Tax=Araneus ventricosus TaxID=182803 RepID=A0A4Y2DYA5_ARAVE|nr:hypothetical protein AVEN_9697-1 [Araneus ventricosus]